MFLSEKKTFHPPNWLTQLMMFQLSKYYLISWLYLMQIFVDDLLLSNCIYD